MIKIGKEYRTTPLHNHKGFTLAETLITLVIIGIVAALTVPTLINNHRKELVETRLKATYSILANMFKAAEADYGTFGTWDFSEFFAQVSSSDEIRDLFIDKYMLPYLKIAADKTQSYEEFGYKKLLYPGGDSVRNLTRSTRFLVLNNGITMWFQLYTRRLTNGKILAYQVFIWVDIDGPGHGPNVVGKDNFLFLQPFITGHPLTMYGEYYTNNCWYTGNVSKEELKQFSETNKCTYMVSKDTGEITFIDYREPREVILEHCSRGGNSNDWGPQECGALIRRDGWKISKDYPWL